MKKGKILKCKSCGTEFYIPKNRFETAKFCSRKCSGNSARKRFEGICKICNCKFNFIACRNDKAKYCSRKCYYKGMNKLGTVFKKCSMCNKEFRTSPSRNKNLCSVKCRVQYTFSIKPLESLKNFGSIRRAMQRRGMINHCQECGYQEHKEILGIHHKDENRNNNKIENLIILCPNCHSIKHSQHIPH